MSNSRDSLAIVVFVHNCQAKLETLATRLLEIASELSDQLELVFVDDASNDGSEDVIWQLATRYAQIDHVRNSQRRGFEASLRCGFQLTTGNYVLFCDGTRLLDIERAVRLWRDREKSKTGEEFECSVLAPAHRNLSTRQWLKQAAHYTHRMQNEGPVQKVGIIVDASLFIRERAQLVAQWSQADESSGLPKSLTTGQTGVVRKAPRRPFLLRQPDHAPADSQTETPSRIFRDALDRLRKSVPSS